MSDDAADEEYLRSAALDENLTCHRDGNEARAVCGKCGRPVCGPILNVHPLKDALHGLSRGIHGEYGHGRRIHDSTFHDYADGFGRATLALGLLGVSILFGALFPDLVPWIVSAVASDSLFLDDAIVHSAAILGIALLATLWYQGGEAATDFRILVRRTHRRVLCMGCFESTFRQVVLFYVVTAVAGVLVAVGLLGTVARGSGLPLRIAALGAGTLLLRDDIVALVAGGQGSDPSADGASVPDHEPTED